MCLEAKEYNRNLSGPRQKLPKFLGSKEIINIHASGE